MTPEAWERSGSFLGHAGHRSFYREEGKGQPLLLLHGFPTAGRDWHRVWPELARRHRVVAPDLLGYGFSDKPRTNAYSTAAQADRIEALAAQLGIKSCHLLAHDYGGTVAQELLARQLEGPPHLTLKSVCLLNGGLFYEAIRPRLAQRLLLSPLGPWVARLYDRRRFERSMRPLFGQATQPTSADLDALWQLVERGGGNRVIHRLIRYLPERRLERARWGRALTECPVPLRFIWGPDDPVSGQAMAERIRELIPAADLVELPGVGHFPQLEAPDAVLEAYREFRSIGARKSGDRGKRFQLASDARFVLDGTDFGCDEGKSWLRLTEGEGGTLTLDARLFGHPERYEELADPEESPWNWTLYPPELSLFLTLPIEEPGAGSDAPGSLHLTKTTATGSEARVYLMEHSSPIDLTLSWSGDRTTWSLQGTIELGGRPMSLHVAWTVRDQRRRKPN